MGPSLLHFVFYYRHIGPGYASLVQGKWERSKVNLVTTFYCNGLKIYNSAVCGNALILEVHFNILSTYISLYDLP